MRFIHRVIENNFKYLKYFFSELRYRILVSLGLSFFVGLIDGFGLAMFLPLLKMIGGNELDSSNADMGNLSFLVESLTYLNIPYTLISILGLISLFFVLKGVLKFIDGYYKMKMQRFFMKKLRYKSVDNLAEYSYEQFVKADVGQIQNTLSGELNRVLSAYKFYFLVIQAVVMVLVYVLLAFISNPEFALIVFIGGVFTNFIYRSVYKKTKKSSKELVGDNNDFQGRLIQMVGLFKYLKATGKIKEYAIKLKKIALNIETTTMRMGWYNVLLGSTREPLIVLVVCLVIYIQTEFMGQSLGLIIISLMFFYRSLIYLMNLQTQWNSFLNVSGSLDSMRAFLADLSNKRDVFGSQKIDTISKIQLDQIYFSYDENNALLENVNLEIHKNEVIAFVGESGSGKTTLINIISGLLNINSGSLLIDNVAIKNIYVPSMQNRIGYIAQEPVIFSDDIFNNVTFWAERTEENVNKFWMVLEKAAIADFVRELPQRENTLLGNNGILVSGGQKQRFSIARELFKDIDLLIMDEATSALDSETERTIQGNIDQLKGQYTILIVAHRLATIRNADRVVLMKKGKIIGNDSFNDLRKKSKEFDRMVNLQEF